MKWRWKKLRQKGQMVIFLALMFQVLFVFFAMVINVGMLVHQKINLQNAVDLGAYYGATKQAEMLNAIGHMNYQIRQAWKLMSWRYRVLGQMGVRTHPWRGGGGGGETPWAPINGNPRSYLACITYDTHWAKVPDRETSCFRVNNPNYNVPALPIPQVSATFLDFNNQVRALAIQLRQAAFDRCTKLGFVNWFYVATIKHAYKQDIANRKDIIVALANAMSGSTEDFVDARGESVAAGVQKTVFKNLSDAHGSQEGVNIRMFNSMGADGCSGQQNWLPEITTDPVMMYADFEGALTAGCRLAPKFTKGPPAQSRPFFFNENVSALGDPQTYENVYQLTSQEQANQLTQSSLGYEKNPWCMSYVGVSAESTPRLPFMPIGTGIRMRAQAFAKPFGGRVGPWYQSIWPSGSPRSSGGTKVDGLIGPRTDVGGNIAAQDPTRLPNYSRFPGDQIGLTSQQVQSTYGQQINQMVQASGKVSLDWMLGGLDIYTQQGNPGDPLMFNDQSPGQQHPIRQLELAAIKPDIFDITYYSIEPRFDLNYAGRILGGNLQSSRGGPARLRADLGGRGNGAFSILAQMGASVAMQNQLPYIVANPGNVLTGWAENSTIDFSMGAAGNFFGNCLTGPSPSAPTPGNCVVGGRSGYSVKIINGSMLGESMELGGSGGSGNINNPPPEEF